MNVQLETKERCFFFLFLLNVVLRSEPTIFHYLICMTTIEIVISAWTKITGSLQLSVHQFEWFLFQYFFQNFFPNCKLSLHSLIIVYRATGSLWWWATSGSWRQRDGDLVGHLTAWSSLYRRRFLPRGSLHSLPSHWSSLHHWWP